MMGIIPLRANRKGLFASARCLFRARRVAPVAVAVAAVLACSGVGDVPDDDAAVLPLGLGVMVSEGEAQVGAVETFDARSHARIGNSGSDFDGDAHLRRLVDPLSGRERYFLLESNQQRVLELDAHGHIVRKTRVDADRPGGYVNPLDIAIAADGALWVSRHNADAASVLVLEPDGQPRCTVNLMPFADPVDRTPNSSAIAIVGNTAYVALRNLGPGGSVVHTAKIVAIDTRGCVARPFVDLIAPNPWEQFTVRHESAGGSAGAELWVSCIGGPLMHPRPKGTGLLRVELATGAQKIVFGEDAAQGFVNSYAIADDHTAWAIVGAWDQGNATSVVKFDPTTGERDPTWGPIRTPEYKLWNIQVAADAELLFVADRTERSPGVRVLSTRDGARLGLLRSRVLPPMELLVLHEAR